MGNLKILKTIYDKLGNDYLRSTALSAAGMLGIRKNLIRMDTNCCCNIHCIMCNSTPSTQSLPFMTFDEFQVIMDQFGPTTRMLYLSCAYEPLITPRFSKYLQYAKDKGIPHISFCTNALLLDENLIHTLIECEIDEVIVSFNGFCKEDYNRIMKGSDFDKVCNNLKKLADSKRKCHSDKPKIRMNTVLLKSNLLHFDSMFQLVEDYDIDFIQFRELVLCKNQNNPDEVKKELPEKQSPEEYQRMIQVIQNITDQLQKCGKKIIIPTSILHHPKPVASMETAEEFHPVQAGQAISPNIQKNLSGSVKEKWAITKTKNIRKHRCSIPFFTYWIDCRGNVKVCGYDKNAMIGNILTDPSNLLAEKRKSFQKQALSGDCQHQKCSINVDTSTII